jgi:ABC-type transport system involved in cytochrome c biogenesis permease subunit
MGRATYIHRKFWLFFAHVSSVLTLYSTPLQTVLLSIALLTVMGAICSLTTKSLHKLILWFAPINSMLPLADVLTKIGSDQPKSLRPSASV